MTALVPQPNTLTMDDLERLAFKYGGWLEPVGSEKARLVGAVMDGRELPPIGPVLVGGAS